MNTAVVLSGGSGKRMGTDIPKQYIELNGKPILYYSLKQFEDSFIDNIVIVAAKEYIEFCQKDIVDRFGLKKVSAICAGGVERYNSVWEGIKAAGNCDYIYIHDGARPFIDIESLYRLKQSVEENGACVAAMPVKDTIKVVDENYFAKETPPRKNLWQIQTPQVFEYGLIREAYRKYIEEDGESIFAATDDAMMVERLSDKKVKLVEATYNNIKITTPEDIEVARCILDINQKHAI